MTEFPSCTKNIYTEEAGKASSKQNQKKPTQQHKALGKSNPKMTPFSF